MIPLTHYLILSGVLFAIGLMGVIVRRDIIVIFMCLEMMLSAANLSLVAFSRAQGTMGLPNYDGQALSIFILPSPQRKWLSAWPSSSPCTGPGAQPARKISTR